MAVNIFSGLTETINHPNPASYTVDGGLYLGGSTAGSTTASPVIADSRPWSAIELAPPLMNISVLHEICSNVDDRLKVSLDTVNNYDGRAEITIRVFYDDVSSKKILMKRSYTTYASGHLIADYDKTVDLLIKEIITDMFRVGFPYLMKSMEDRHRHELDYPLTEREAFKEEQEVGDGKSYGL